MKHYEDLKELVNTLDLDVQKFNSGNAAAGTRARKKLQEIKKIAQEFRIAIQESKTKQAK